MKASLTQSQLEAELMLTAKTKELTSCRQKMIQLEADEETKDALRRQNKVLNTKNLSLESQVERLCAVRDNIDAVNGRLNTSFKHKNVSFVDDEVQEEIIGTDQFLIKTKINEFKSTITNLQAEKDRLKVNLEQRSREKTELEEKLEDRQHELDRKEAAVDRLQIKLTAEVHKREGAGAASEELDKIKKQNISLRCMIEDLQSLVDRLQKEK